MKSIDSAEFQVVVFDLDGEFYALPVTHVREVRRLEALTRLPESPEFMMGVLRLGERILSVMDLGKKLGHGPVQPSDKSRILIVRLSDTWMGLLVGEVRGISTLSQEVLRRPPETAQKTGSTGYLSAIVHSEGRLILLLDPLKLLGEKDHEELRNVPLHA